MYFTTQEFIEYINKNYKENLDYIYTYIKEQDFIDKINKKQIYINDCIDSQIYQLANELFDKKYLSRKVKSYIIKTNDEDFIKLYHKLYFLNSLKPITPKGLFEFKVDNLDIFKNFLKKTKKTANAVFK